MRKANMTKNGPRKSRGFSMVESFIVTSLIGMMGLVSIPALSKGYHEYQLNRSCREVMANLQLAKLKSVSNNFSYSFRFSSTGSNTYQVSGSEALGPDGTFHVWNDANGNGQRDNDRIYQTARKLPYATFSTTGVSALPNGSYVGTVPATITMTFEPDGRLATGQQATNYRCVVLQDGTSRTRSVCVDNSGMVRLFKQINNSWVESK